MFNPYLPKIFSSVCDNNKAVYTIWKQWSHIEAAPSIFGAKLKQKGAAYTQVFTVYFVIGKKTWTLLKKYSFFFSNSDADETKNWINEKDKVLSSDDYGKDLASVNALLRKHEALERDLAAVEDKVNFFFFAKPNFCLIVQ